MKEWVACLLAAVVCAALMGACRKDAEVGATLAEIDSFTQELVRRVDAAPSPSEGVDDAQRYFDSRKAEITTKLSALREVRGGEVEDREETRRKMEESLTTNLLSIDGLRTKHIRASMDDPNFQARLDKLVGDYKSLFKF